MSQMTQSPMAKQDSYETRKSDVDGATGIFNATSSVPPKKKSRSSSDQAAIKRRCVSTACVACRRRKSKCDGNLPSCAACSSVYGTECVYDPNSDHRRKGVYREKIDSSKTRNSTLQTLVQAILNAKEHEVPGLVRQIRTCENLDDVADAIMRAEQGLGAEIEDESLSIVGFNPTAYTPDVSTFEAELSGKMGQLRLENGSVRFIGGTSNLIYLAPSEFEDASIPGLDALQQQEDPLLSWTTVTRDTEVIVHLINMYFTWHYPYFTTLSKSLFYRDFLLGKPPVTPNRTVYCSSLLVNAMLALGCHFTNSPAGCADPDDPATKGDAFFAEAKRLIVENDEYEKPRLVTVQALALMSVREAGCGREAKGWVYSGMSFRMAQDMGLNLDSGGMAASKETMDDGEIDARRVTFWGCFLFDKCWSNYLGRLPQLPGSNITVPKYDVFPGEDSDIWSPYTDSGTNQMYSQASRTRAVALQISNLCEISSDLLIFFYHPQALEKSMGKSAELKKLSELQTRLEAWRRDLPKEFEAKEGQLPNILLMHMFFHLLYIHLFRPFLKYNPSTSPLPTHVSPRKLCTQAASLISKIMRIYKRTYGLRQICNIAVYMVHSACTIHLLNLPEKTAKRDIVHGVKHLEEIAEDWLCARRTLSILSVLTRKWKIILPEEASTVLARTDSKFGTFSTSDVPSPRSEATSASPVPASSPVHNKHLYQVPRFFNPDMQNQSMAGSSNMGQLGMLSNGLAKPIGVHANIQNIISPIPPPGNGPTSLTPDSAAQLNNNYMQRHVYMNGQQQATSGASSSMTTRQVSPSTLFGGVDSLMESQDWWLKDQASLAVGFDNWGIENTGGNRNSRSQGLAPGQNLTVNGSVDGNGNVDGRGNGMSGIPGGYYMPQNGNAGNLGGRVFGNNEWYA